MPAKSVLYWIRNDLRLADNPTLTAAIASGLPIVPVFIWSPEEEGNWPHGAATRAWFGEFERLLKPGGVVAFTTRHASFFDFCEQASKQPGASPYVQALGELFPDFDVARAALARGELVHASSPGVGGGGPRDDSFYGETWIPEAYVRQGMGTSLQFVSGYFDGTRYGQACFVMRKPA